MKSKFLKKSSSISLKTRSNTKDDNLKNSFLLSPNSKFFETKRLNFPKINIIKQNLSDIDLSYLTIKPIENKKFNFPIRKQKSQIIKDNLPKNKINTFLQNSKSFNFENSPAKFHNKLMLKNISSYNKSQIEEYMEKLKNDKLNDIEISKQRKESCITGIYGPSSNVLNVIRANIERLKYDKDYLGAKNDIKEMIKDEIMLAQVKLKIKPKPLMFDKFKKIKPLYLKKFDEIKYITSRNKINILNQNAKIPMILNDGAVINSYLNDTFKMHLFSKNKDLFYK